MAKSLKNQFADWVSKQPRDAAYTYCDPYGCPFALFLDDAGYIDLNGPRPQGFGVGPLDWTDNDGVEHPMPADIEDAVNNVDATFGALADRLDA